MRNTSPSDDNARSHITVCHGACACAARLQTSLGDGKYCNFKLYRKNRQPGRLPLTVTFFETPVSTQRVNGVAGKVAKACQYDTVEPGKMDDRRGVTHCGLGHDGAQIR